MPFWALGKKGICDGKSNLSMLSKKNHFLDTEEELFTLVDSDGNPVEGQQLGLLLYRGGTVCDDGFDDTAAEAVCRQINSSYRMIKWTTGGTFDIQNNLDINLDDVRCSSTDWGSCEYSEEHNCDHSEDVFLTCENPKGIPINQINLSSTLYTVQRNRSVISL